MKIVIYRINYAPELTSTGKYTTEMAQWLASVGNEARAITAPPYYPAWKVSDAYSAWRYHRESIDGVDVFRTPLWVPSQPTGLRTAAAFGQFCHQQLARSSDAMGLEARRGVAG